MGELYLIFIQQKQFNRGIIEALEIMAETENHPLIFHCAAGKDRTGILAAIVLSILDIADEYIVNDYCLSSVRMDVLQDRIKSEFLTDEDIKILTDYRWEADAASMKLFLTSIKKEYVSMTGWVQAQGADITLVKRLESALLV